VYAPAVYNEVERISSRLYDDSYHTSNSELNKRFENWRKTELMILATYFTYTPKMNPLLSNDLTPYFTNLIIEDFTTDESLLDYYAGKLALTSLSFNKHWQTTSNFK